MQTQCDSVLDIRLHALENLASNLDGQHNRGKTGGEEDDIGSGLSGFRSTFDSDTAIGFLEGWSIVDT
jgi:hypothetical protein